MRLRRILASLGAMAALAAFVGAAEAQPADSAAQADSTARAARGGTRFFPLPALSSAPETGVAGGVSLSAVRRRAGAAAGDRPSSANTYGLYSAKRQLTLAASADHWTRGNALNVRTGVVYSRFPFQFWGVGNDIPDSAERYTPHVLAATAAVQRQLRPGLFVGGGYTWSRTRIADDDSAPSLRARRHVGSAGGVQSALALTAATDTRDDLFAARRGRFAGVTVASAGGPLGGDFDFRRVTADARGYRVVRAGAAGRAPHVVAVQLWADAVTAGTPFDRLPQLGGDRLLRGYFAGRYRDRAAAVAQAEYRLPVWRRLGAAAFAGAGAVGRDAGELATHLRPSAGLGLRYQLSANERLNIRVDAGAGRDGAGLYLGLGEAF